MKYSGTPAAVVQALERMNPRNVVLSPVGGLIVVLRVMLVVFVSPLLELSI
jgi:hypothetical protein